VSGECTAWEADISDQSLNLGRFAALALCRADVLFQVSSDMTIKFSWGPAEKFFGGAGTPLIGSSFLNMIAEDDQQIVGDYFYNENSASRVEDVILTSAKGSKIAISGYRVPDFDNDFFLAVKISPKQTIPISRQPEAQDAESGVLSGEAYTDLAAQRIKSFEASGGKPKVSMVNIGDLSDAGFAEGSEEAGQVLRAIGDVLNSESLGGDTAGRVDDGSFSLIHGDDVNAEELSEKIANAMSKAAPGANLMPKIATMDAGSAGMDEQQLAKAMMYSLQKFTKGEPLPDGDLSAALQSSLAENVASVQRFRKIVEDGSFDLVYMPVCSLKDGHIHHYEALTRFRDEAGESPFALITLAEEVGVISDFDLAVAERAIQTIVRAQKTAPPTPVAINVSGHSIGDPLFCAELDKMLHAQFGIDEFLSLEITESAEIEDLKGVNAAIQEFRRAGFKVALDDFGAGAASFDYLNSFDVDTVKFDGPVVKRAVVTKKGKAFLASMATLCREIDVETIAEMVEDEPLAKFLGECGIELGQGWHFGKPMPAKEAFKGLEDDKPKAAAPSVKNLDGLSLMERLQAESS
tara:strand:+ start:5665 stop:7398 length:1734 start_codon:yes stop_codon:yes gene_type:complete